MFSTDGYCCGEGVGVVVLKLLASVIKEKDIILGVIVGSVVNQNESCDPITVPHSGSQINLYKTLMSLEGVAPESVSYVEAHSTGTSVGDLIDVRVSVKLLKALHRSRLSILAL
jgi:acyl transferase domain-containing protein